MVVYFYFDLFYKLTTQLLGSRSVPVGTKKAFILQCALASLLVQDALSEILHFVHTSKNAGIEPRIVV
jgi:hypothetical protein